MMLALVAMLACEPAKELLTEEMALRVWQLPPALAADKLDELHDVLPRVSDTLCGKDQCRNTIAAIELARRISRHVTACQ